MKQVLFLLPTLGGGGAERVITSLLKYFDRKKFTLTLAVVDMRHAVFLDEIPKDVELIDLGCRRVRYALPIIAKLIWCRRPDVVFSTLGHLNIALATIRPFLPKNTVFIARETSIVSERLKVSSFSWLWKWAYCLFYPRFNTVVCQSHHMKEDLVNNFNFPAVSAVVIHNPVDIVRVRSLASEPIVTGMNSSTESELLPLINLVAAGRLVHVKGFDILIEALALCGNKRFRLTLLGEGPLRDELEGLALLNGVSEQVRFVGFQKNPYPFFAQADTFVLSSRFEGFPNVVLEALACGTPVVSLPAPGGVCEILEGINSCIIAPQFTKFELSRSIQKIQYGVRLSPSVVDKYAVENVVHTYEKVLESRATF